MNNSLLIGVTFDEIVQALTVKETDQERIVRQFDERRSQFDEDFNAKLTR